MIALIDATMSDLRLTEPDPNALTVFAAEDMTEVNLDLAGALESVVEEETRVAPARRPRAASIPLDLARIEVVPSHTVSQRAPAPASWVEDLLMEEELGTWDTSAEDDLPMLDSGEFMAAPDIDDLRPPARAKSQKIHLLSPPEVRPLMPVRAASAYDGTLPVKIVPGKPIIAMHEDEPLKPDHSTFLWISAIAVWAATMLAAWVHRSELLQLFGS
jgi:hypothetical protein